jgi:hypothetical protein
VHLPLQSEDAERSRRVEIVRDAKWETVELRDGSQFGDTKIFVSLRKYNEILL